MKRRQSDREIVESLLDRVLAQGESMKASVGDIIRLLQLKREVADDRIREIEVRWVEPSQAEDAGSK